MKRRNFIQKIGTGALVVGTGGFPLEALAASKPEIVRLTILHTNDVHSRIDPFPMDGTPNQGLGGVAKRAGLIQKIRQEAQNVLLLDAGDIFQGTPYFNMFGGSVEMQLMSKMGYDAATIGNHDFDNGIDGLAQQMVHANFPLLVANYDFSNTVMKGKTLPYKIFKKQGVKIGVFGLGIALKSLVPDALYKETQYLDPLSIGQKMATLLRQDLGCDYVICLSHLGYKYSRSGDEQKISDVKLAENTRHIDLIIGGHTHTFLNTPDTIKNLDGQPVLVNQAGWGGILLGRIDVAFERSRGARCETCLNMPIG